MPPAPSAPLRSTSSRPQPVEGRGGRRVAAMFDADQLGLRERETLRGIARYAQDADWRLVLDPFAVYHPAGRYDGLLVPTRRWLGPALARAPVPVVCLAWNQRQSSLTHAVENRYQAGRLAAQHLVERGYRTFAYLGFARDTQSRVERTEFHRELRRLGRRVDLARTFVSLARTRALWEEVTASLSDWLGRLRPPVGIFVARPGFARALADLALARGLRIPQDVGIVAADNDPLVCELPPTLTSLHFDYAEVGYRAAELLDRLMAGAPPRREALLIPPTLVPRQSTDRQAVGDPFVAKALWFIDSRRTEPIRASDVAAALGVGQRTLQRRLRRAGRETVHEEILKARVEHAKLLLEGGQVLPPEPEPGPFRLRYAGEKPPPPPRRPAWLPAVARECGFGSYEALFRAFKRHTGMAPSHWSREAEIRRTGAQNAERMPERRGRQSRTGRIRDM